MTDREATRSRLNTIAITLINSSAGLILFLFLLGSCQLPHSGMPGSPVPEPKAVDTRGERKPPLPELRAVDALGEQKTIVILVELPKFRNRFSRQEVHRRVFEELNDYIKEVSYGKTWLTGDMTKKWYVLPDRSVDAVTNSQKNWFSGDLVAYLRPLVELISDAISLADRDIDFSKYRHSVVVIGLSPPAKWYAFGGGAMCGPLAGLEFRTPSGQSVRGSSLATAGAHLGMFAHEFIHQLGGYEEGVYFPRMRARNLARYRRVAGDLYDLKAYMTRGNWHGLTQYYAKYIGPWDLMGFHTVDPNRPPAGPSSFTKLRLGWIAEPQVAIVKPGDFLKLKLNPLELPTSGTQVVKIPLTPNTYYLLEHRQQVGCDSVLPSSGVLIYYVDETIKEAQGILKLVDAHPNIPEFRGAPFDIGPKRNDTFVDKENGWILRLIEKHAGSYTIEIDATKLGFSNRP
ncbi:MAG: hypothetical protein OEW45_05945 [Deltaproteobacteria bacterium]|nr:hypothetical protein [Deltaproteobacteria bacterium]